MFQHDHDKVKLIGIKSGYETFLLWSVMRLPKLCVPEENQGRILNFPSKSKFLLKHNSHNLNEKSNVINTVYIPLVVDGQLMSISQKEPSYLHIMSIHFLSSGPPTNLSLKRFSICVY